MSTEGTGPVNPVTHHDGDIPPEIASLSLADKPDGPGAAIVISAGLAIFVLGVLTILAEASEGASTWLGTWAGDKGVGALAGKTTIASIVYFGSLALLWTLWRNKDVNLNKACSLALVLGILGFVGTFPPFFTMFAG